MAEYLITGGGTALDDALNMRNGFSYVDGDILNVGPGIYSPVNFAYYRKNIEIRSTDGKESTIIDGQGLSTCFKNRFTNTNYIFNLNGFTLSNGFLSSDLSSPGFSGAALHGAVYAYNCSIFDCSAVNLYDSWYTSFSRVAATAGASFSHVLVNCEISGCVADNFCLVRVSRMDHCDIHHNVSTALQRGDQYTIMSSCRKCKFHHNSISGVFLPSSKIVNCQIYRNQGLSSNNWLGERTRQINNIIANNVGFSLENGWGGATYWKNVVCYNNKRTNGNYAGGSFYGNGGRTQIWNCYFDQLSSTIAWNSWNELSGNSRKNSVFIQDADFGFVDPENDDYRLRPDSMLIGKGTWDILSGKTPTETNPNFNGTEDNEWLSSTGDFTSRPWKDPPSVGAYEFIVDKQNIPNDVYPMGREKELTKIVEVKYIEFQRPSSGNITAANPAAVIDTEIVPMPGTSFEIKAQPLSALNGASGGGRIGTDQTINGTRTQFGIDFNVSGWGLVQAYGSTVNMAYKSLDAFIGSFDYETRTLKSINVSSGSEKTTVVPEETDVNYTNTFTLFGRWINDNRTNPQNTGMRLWYCKIWQNGLLVRDMIPVRIGSVGYLYDKVSNRLFSPQGGGQLAYGPDKTST